MKQKVAVIGAGAWGTALAHLLANRGRQVTIWAFEPETAAEINSKHLNSVFLPGVKLNPELRAEIKMAKAAAGAEMVLMVTPSHVLRIAAEELAAHLAPGVIVVDASKGIEQGTHLTMTGVLAQVLAPTQGWDVEDRLAVLSGPSFAKEAARDQPTAVTVASRRVETAEAVQRACSEGAFRVYTASDVIGVELGGAMKNVMAIAAGICAGLGLGSNSMAALITRGLAEISRLGAAMGADPLTFMGLAGMGDLVLTCTSPQSRNYTVGYRLGQGESMDEILSGSRTVAEGIKTTKAAHNLAKSKEVELPICAEVFRMIYQGANPKESLGRLLSRDLKLERWGMG